MAIVDLSQRTTNNWTEYNECQKSAESLIHINGEILLENVGPASMNLTVGTRWYDCEKKQYKQISDKGFKLKQGQTVIIETSQEIALPFNIFGVIYGTGKNIFRGGIVSTGKINPGFHGKLKVGYYNGNNATIIFKPGDLLACCAFYDVETHLTSQLERYLTEPEPEFEPDTFRYKLKNWFARNWNSVISIIISIIAVIVAAQR